jgi:predicted nucleotidyltransferase component of viral defense system
VIPKADIVGWRRFAPWISDAQVEQDLIISRALVAIFQDKWIAKETAFRGGTALHKLYLNPARRYSEDIDLVQITSGPIGPFSDALQGVLNPFLGEPRRKQAEGGFTLTYRVESEGPPVIPMRLKIEINTREHFAVMGIKKKPYSVQTRWFNGTCNVPTFSLEELLCTKVRALYQRRKGRDLFDLWLGLIEGKADPVKIVEIFKYYLKTEGHHITGKDFQKNLDEKMYHIGFLRDIAPLLSAGVQYDAQAAYRLITREILSRL